MSNIFQILMKISGDFLQKSDSGSVIDENEFEFAEYICESMVALGSYNLQCIVGDSSVLSFYLQQVISCCLYFTLTATYLELIGASVLISLIYSPHLLLVRGVGWNLFWLRNSRSSSGIVCIILPCFS